MKAVKLLIERYSHGEKQTIGNLFGLSENGHILFECDSLELPWLNNQTDISCIPVGNYKVKKRYSKAHKNHLHILDVPDREWVLIHPANSFYELRGCVATGKLGYLKDGDDIVDVKSSRETLNSILNSIELDENKEIDLEIVNI